jgi:peptide/nickel transport system permease protein
MTDSTATQARPSAPEMPRRTFTVVKARSRTLRPWYKILPLMVGLSIVLFLILVAVLAPWISPYNPLSQDLTHVLQAPSAKHWLGTDNLGRDVLSRLIWGTRADLTVGFLAVIIPFIFGTIVGAIAGYFGGIVDAIIMRVVDVFFAFPFYVLVIALVYVLGTGEKAIFIAIAAVSWVSYCKIVRGEVLIARNQDYVIAARLGGLSHRRIISGHIIRNVIAQAVVYAMSDIVLDILAIVTLGYLGLGIQPPTPDWGGMIVAGQDFITTQWWLSTIPGLAVVFTGFGLSLTGDGLAELLAPERRK